MNSNINEKFIKVEDMKTLKTHGVGHWKLQRISAIATITFVIWLTTALMLQ